MGPNILQNADGQIRPSPNAEPDCSKGASSNVCKVSASLDRLTIPANMGRIAVQALVIVAFILSLRCRTGTDLFIQSKKMHAGCGWRQSCLIVIGMYSAKCRATL